MFRLINDILTEFKPCFNRERTWNWFICVVMAFMIRPDHRGVTSVISSLGLLPRFYEQILHFFRSEAYKTTLIYQTWIQVAQKHLRFEKESGYVVLAGDPIKVAKEGRRMPGVHTYHQDSENSGKREYAEGHQFGVVSAIAVSGAESRSIPLSAAIQESKTKTGKDSLIEQMVDQGGSILPELGQKAILVLDAYFCSGTTFQRADRYKDTQGIPQLAIITRAKTDTVAFEQPPEPKSNKRGRPRIYGEKYKLYTLFQSAADEFIESEVFLYGKKRKVRYLCKNLIWKSAERVIRFVWVEIVGTDKRAVFMCSDLALLPEAIIRLYGLRFKIETGFDDLKNDLGGFAYHFWTKSLPKKKKWKDVEMPTDERAKKNIEKARQAIEMHVCMSCIACGILSIIGFRHNREIWDSFSGWLRTIRSPIPSVATTRQALAQAFYAFLPSLCKLPELPVFNIIYSRRRFFDAFSDVA